MREGRKVEDIIAGQREEREREEIDFTSATATISASKKLTFTANSGEER